MTPGSTQSTQGAADLPPAVLALIGRPQYEERSEFPIEIGYVYNTCAATQNGNPLYWDERVARELAGARIAPPTMLSVVVGNEAVFGEPVRIGDVLMSHQVVRSVGELKATKLGTGRFWVIDVETRNQRGEWVGTETYSFLGYRRPESAP